MASMRMSEVIVRRPVLYTIGVVLFCLCGRSDSTLKFKRTRFFFIEYRVLDSGRINHIARVADSAFARIADSLGLEVLLTNEDQITLTICENREDYLIETLSLGASLDDAIYSCGITFSNLEAIVVYKDDNRLDERILVHEISHCVINAGTGRRRLPRWLNEGLALYFEAYGGQATDVISALPQIKAYQSELSTGFISFADLEDFYPKLPEDRLMMYYQSYAFTHFLIHQFGFEKFRQLLNLFMHTVLRPEAIFERTYAKSLNQLQEDWQATVP